MLLQFNFENFKSFQGKAILDLSATRETEFSEHIVMLAGEKILPVAVIYGANACGKTNVFEAFGFMTKYVMESFEYGGETEKFKKDRPMPFLLDSVSENSESSFEVFFTVPGDETEKVYNYGFSLGPEGVKEEWLNSRAKTSSKARCIFYRNTAASETDLSGIPKKFHNNILVSLEKQALIISLGAKLKIEKCKMVRDWFSDNRLVDFAVWDGSYNISNNFPRKLIEDPESQKNIIKFFASFGEDIEGLEVKDADPEGNTFTINTKRKKNDSDGVAEIPLRAESAGTQKMLTIYPFLQDVLKSGSVLFVDELNARLHPLLTRNIILTFLNPKLNTKHAQLIFTAHDTWQMSNQLLRRDEIWFVDKDAGGVSHVYSLADFIDYDGFKIRKDENYEKNYLLGKYGAIPSVKYFDMLPK